VNELGTTNASFQWACICYEQSRFDEARVYLEKVIEAEPNLATPCFLLANIHDKFKRQEQALFYLLKGAALEPQGVPAQVHLDLSRYLMGQGRLAEAIESCQRALKVDPKFTPARELSAELYRRQGKLDEALRSLRGLLVKDPALDQFNNKEHVDYSLSSKIWELTQQIDRVRDELESDSSVTSTARVEDRNLWHEGSDYARIGKLDVAEEQIQKAVQGSPNFAEAHFNLGVIRASLGRSPWQPSKLQQAIECFQKAIQLRPDWAEAYFKLGKTLEALLVTGCENQPSDLRPIDISFQRAIAHRPDHAEAYRSLAVSADRQGRASECDDYFRKYAECLKAKAGAHPLGKLGLRFLDDINTYAIGHLSHNLDCYVKLQRLGWLPEHKTILLAHPARVSNPSLLGYWRKYFEIITDSSLIRDLYPLSRALHHNASLVSLPDGRTVRIYKALTFVEAEWTARGYGPLLSLSEADRERGWRCLEEMGVPKGSWFVSLHVREPGFKREGLSLYNGYRNANIDTYAKAIDSIVARDGWVVRLGEPSMKSLRPQPQVIDYAHSQFKSDWMDIFLASQCRFFVGTPAGIGNTPLVFGVPLVATNWSTNTLTLSSRDLIMPKLIRHTRENRLLTFRELLSPPVIYNENGIFFAQNSMEFVDNTPDELKGAVLEMLDRLSGCLSITPDDERLQRDLASKVALDLGVWVSRAPSDFLRRHSDLLKD